MKFNKMIGIAVLSALAHPSYSQKEKTVLASVDYLVTYIKDGKTLIKDICVLDVSKNQSYFQSRDGAEREAKFAEKMATVKLTNTKPSFDFNDIPPKTSYKAYILKNYDKKQSITIQLVGTQLLGYVKNPAVVSNWKILDEKSVINGLNSQKAQIVKDDVIIIAWFCKDVPIQDGPLAYFGLPGLITKISTSDGWEAEFKQIVNVKDWKKQLNVVDYALVSEADIKKATENARATRGNGMSMPGMSIQKQN